MTRRSWQSSDISVLMATYGGEQPARLAQALDSLLTQTALPGQCVLMLDGPVGAGQEAVIAGFVERAAFTVTVERLPENRGLALALNAGLPLCQGGLIARMDSDDICRPQRFEAQVEAMNRQPPGTVVCAWSDEFEGTPDNVIFLNRPPPDHETILRLLRWRNPLVHPTLMIETDLLRRVGGYNTALTLIQDYDLHVRLARAGARFHVVQQALLLFRTSHQQRIRRGGWRFVAREVAFRHRCWRTGFTSLPVFVTGMLMLALFRLAPAPAKKVLYRLVRESA